MNEAGGQKRLVVVDPALITASGHHAGLATFIANTVADSRFSVDYICHQDADTEIIQALEQAGIKVHALFTINFYQYFDQAVRIQDMQDYLLQGTHEYNTALNVGRAQPAKVGEAYPKTIPPTLYFYPTLNWDHAFILSLTLRRQPPSPGELHKCCAMFNPGIDHRGTTIDTLQELNYRLAFRPLSRCNQVELYASDAELARKYQAILEQQSPLPLHPVYLANWKALETKQATPDRQGINVTLYLGDAKINKGFCCLPDLIRKLLNQENASLNLYVQYTHSWPDATIEAAIAELEAINQRDARLTLEEGYLTDAGLHERLRMTDVFVFAYDEAAYGEKSSGILHLVAWYGIASVFLGQTWLNREAERLGLPSLELTDNEVSAERFMELVELPEMTECASKTGRIEAYREQLYYPFWRWLDDTSRKKSSTYHV